MPPDDSLSRRPPTPAEAEKAAKAGTSLASHRDRRGGLSLHVKKGARSADVDLPPAVARLVLDLLELVGKGDAVTLVPSGADLSTQQAADMLEVSRPFLVKLLETREIPHHKIGTHRRIRAEDLLAYKRRRDKTRTAARTRLARLAQESDD
ncbi:MAG: DNA binding domain-containing protein [Rhodospirillaceae bacterium]|nr:MAG: DNA binding domain-containing protein [Rhodospirillaceae bacterium]